MVVEPSALLVIHTSASASGIGLQSCVIVTVTESATWPTVPPLPASMSSIASKTGCKSTRLDSRSHKARRARANGNSGSLERGDVWRDERRVADVARFGGDDCGD